MLSAVVLCVPLYANTCQRHVAREAAYREPQNSDSATPTLLADPVHPALRHCRQDPVDVVVHRHTRLNPNSLSAQVLSRAIFSSEGTWPSSWSHRRNALIAREYVLTVTGLAVPVRICSMRARKAALVRPMPHTPSPRATGSCQRMPSGPTRDLLKLARVCAQHLRLVYVSRLRLDKPIEPIGVDIGHAFGQTATGTATGSHTRVWPARCGIIRSRLFRLGKPPDSWHPSVDESPQPRPTASPQGKGGALHPRRSR
jgi:hypothetical protein